MVHNTETDPTFAHLLLAVSGELQTMPAVHSVVLPQGNRHLAREPPREERLVVRQGARGEHEDAPGPGYAFLIPDQTSGGRRPIAPAHLRNQVEDSAVYEVFEALGRTGPLLADVQHDQRSQGCGPADVVPGRELGSEAVGTAGEIGGQRTWSALVKEKRLAFWEACMSRQR